MIKGSRRRPLHRLSRAARGSGPPA
jgi:hypothetical protein